jgi:hypothetical protein
MLSNQNRDGDPMKKIFLFIIINSLIICTSCGNKDKKTNKNSSQSFEETNLEGNYRAILRPLNNHLSGYLPTGLAEIEIKDGQLVVSTLLDDDAKVLHIQSIQDGTKCPSFSDDQNQDGVIDIEEATSIAGEVLINLDGALDGAIEGDGLYPWGSGFYYKKSAEIAAIENEIRLRTRKKLSLTDRVVMIYGVSKTTILPETVATRLELPTNSTIPVVCGVIKKVQS